MTKCLSPQELDRYRSGQLESVEELLTVESHLDECVSCRQALQRAVSGAAPDLKRKLTTPPGGVECPDRRLLERYARGEADATDRELVRTHIEDCARCAEALTLLQASTAKSTQTEQPARRPGWPAAFAAFQARLSWALGATAAAAAIAVYALGLRPIQVQNTGLRSKVTGLEQQLTRAETARQANEARLAQLETDQTQKQRQIAKLQRQTALAARELQQQQKRTELLIARNDTGTPPWALAAVSAATTGHIPDIPRLTLGANQITRSGSEPEKPDIALRSPVATVILEPHPIFRWTPVPGAAGYTLTVINEAEPDEIKPQPVRAQGEWREPRALRRGQTYEWAVETQVGGRKLSSPIAKFMVLGQSEADLVTHMQQQYAHQPLILGVIFARAGLLDAAEQEFQAGLKAHPESTVFRSLIDDVRKARVKDEG